jgi:hypothetical protein
MLHRDNITDINTGFVQKVPDEEAERVEFIRRAAIGIAVSTKFSVLTTEAVWGCARELWDAKPEDC